MIFEGRGLDITSTFYKSRSKIVPQDEFVFELDTGSTVKGEHVAVDIIISVV